MVQALEIMPDHVQLSVRTGPDASPALVAHQCKGFTSRVLRAEFPHLRSRLPTLWSKSYLVTSVGHVSAATIGRYIAEHIEGARFVEFPGADHLICTEDPEAVVDEIEEFLTGAKPARPPERMLATVLFTDIVDSTATAAKLGDRSWGELLDRHDALVRARVENHQGRVVNWTGDGVLAMFDGPTRAIESARAIVAAAPSLGIEVRAGLHSGECELRGDHLGGMAVHIGARVSARAGAGEVLVSSTLKDLVVGSGIEFDDRGTAELKGVPGEWRLYALAG